MSWFYNLKISVKLVSSFVLIALIAGVIGVIGVMNITSINDGGTELYEVNTVPLGLIGDVAVAFQRTRVNVRDIVLDENVDNQAKYMTTLAELDQQINDDIIEIRKIIKSEIMIKDYDILLKSIEEYAPAREEIINLSKANQKDEAFKLMKGDAFVTAQAVDDSIKNMFEESISLAQQQSLSNESTSKSAITTMVAFIIIGMILAVGLGIFTAIVRIAPARIPTSSLV